MYRDKLIILKNFYELKNGPSEQSHMKDIYPDLQHILRIKFADMNDDSFDGPGWTYRNIIDRIPLNNTSGSLAYYRSPEAEYQSQNYFYPIKLSSLSVQLYDNDSNKLYDSSNGDNYFEFEITIVKNIKLFK